MACVNKFATMSGDSLGRPTAWMVEPKLVHLLDELALVELCMLIHRPIDI